MNMQAIMKLRKELEKTQNELDNTIYTYENENIKVECKGSSTITKVEIKNKEILEDEEMLGDIIQVAVNDVLDQSNKDKERKLSKYTAGLGGLF